MLKAILLDMDDTLLDNGEAYHSNLVKWWVEFMEGRFPYVDATSATQAAMQAVLAKDGTGPTNLETLDSTLSEETGLDWQTLAGLGQLFDHEVLPRLRSFTRCLPEAREVMEWVFQRGLQVAIVSGSHTSLNALEQRLEWAGVPVTDFNYALLTGLGNMHANKPNPAYYIEVLDKLDRQPVECLMVGDDWDLDIRAAAAVGLPCFWIAEPGAELPEEGIPLVGQGTLSDLLRCLEAAEQRGFSWEFAKR